MSGGSFPHAFISHDPIKNKLLLNSGRDCNHSMGKHHVKNK